MSLFKSTAVIAFFTLLSRVSGLVRDLLMANYLGASFLSDAFFVAFKIPNFFRRLFAEGAFNAAFVPSFAGLLTAEGRKAAVDFAAEVMSVLLVALLVLNALFIIFMPWILPLFAPGFADSPEKFGLTVTLSRICFPYILFISLVSLLGGILNSLHKFWVNAAAPILLNVTLIVALLAFHSHEPLFTARNQAIAVSVSGLLQLLWLAWACRANGVSLKLRRPRLTPEVRHLMKLILPAAAGAGAVHQLPVGVVLQGLHEGVVADTVELSRHRFETDVAHWRSPDYACAAGFESFADNARRRSIGSKRASRR